jgi:hypothetical protein
MFFNTKECEWSDCEVFIAGKKVTKITDVSFKINRDTESLAGAGNEPIGIQSGAKSYEGKITLYKGAIDDLNTAAQTAGYNDLTDIDFDIVITFKERADRPRRTYTLIGGRAAGYEIKFGSGDKSSKSDIDIKFLSLKIV